MITLSTRVAAPDGVLCRDVEDEAVLVNAKTGVSYALNNTGTRTWTVLLEQASLAAALPILAAEYEASAEELQADLIEFVSELAALGLLAVDDK